MEWLIEQACQTANVKPLASIAPAGVELLQRVNGNASWLFVLNHLAEKVTIPLEQSGVDLLTGKKVDDSFELDPTDVAIIQSG